MRAESAGTEPSPEIWPPVVEAMREIGFDLSGRKPKKLTLEMQLHADWAITMGCGDACPYVPTIVEAWDIPDPAARPIEDVRRDPRRHPRSNPRADPPSAWKRSAPTAPPTSFAFDGFCRCSRRSSAATRSPEEIRACADAVLEGFADARVRSHVMTLAHRQTRECLRRETCDLIAAREGS